MSYQKHMSEVCVFKNKRCQKRVKELEAEQNMVELRIENCKIGEKELEDLNYKKRDIKIRFLADDSNQNKIGSPSSKM